MVFMVSPGGVGLPPMPSEAHAAPEAEAAPLSVPRHHVALQAAHLVANASACRDGQPQLPGMAARACDELACIQLPAWGCAHFAAPGAAAPTTCALDLAYQAFTPVPAELAASCLPAVGGQLGAQPLGAVHGAAAPPLPPPSPRVSVVITTQGQVRQAMQCVLEVFRTAAEADSLELVVVDDGGVEDLAPLRALGEALSRGFGVPFTLLNHTTPAGAAVAANTGAAAARGELLVLLQSDVLVLPGWLHGLLSTLDTQPALGLVGPAVVAADGAVAEAGNIVYSTGQALAIGRGQPLSSPALNYLRTVDYVGGQCFMMRRTTYVDQVRAPGV